MKTHSSLADRKIVRSIARALSWGALFALTSLLLLAYNAAYYWYTPLTGVDWEYTDNTFTAKRITSVPPGSPAAAGGLRVGDGLLAVDGQAFTTLNRPLYTRKAPGEIVRYSVMRAGQRLEIDVIAGDYRQPPGYLLPMFALTLLSLLVYAVGLACLRFAAQGWGARLVGLTWLLAGLAVAADGPGYFNGGWFVVDVIITIFAVAGCVSLAAHLYFPAPLFSRRARVRILFIQSTLALLLLAAYFWQRALPANQGLPPQAFTSSLLIRALFYSTWPANIFLLFLNRFTAREAEARRQANILLGGMLLGVAPYLALSVLPQLVVGPQAVILPGQASILTLVFIPLSYGYAISQRKLLWVDRLFNRIVACSTLLLAALFAAGCAAGLLIALHADSPQALLFGVVLTTLLVGLALRKKIRALTNYTLYGAHYDFESVIERLTDCLSQAAEWRDFHAAAQIEVAQPMRAEQSAVLLVDRDGQLQLGGAQGEARGLAPDEDGICLRLLHTRRPERAAALEGAWNARTRPAWAGYEWARVFAPLLCDDQLRGIWLLGERRGGNYSNQDVANLHAIGKILALTIVKITQAEMLRNPVQILEQERAHDPAAKILLVVDDDPAELEANALILQAQPACYRVVTAPGGRAALSVLWQMRPDLLLLDLDMPDIDGFAVLANMARSKTTHDIPVILFSDRALQQAELERLPLRVTKIVEKRTLNWDEVLVYIREALLGQKTQSVEMQLMGRNGAAYIHLHYKEDLSPDDLAGLLGVSADYLTECIRLETGMTPSAYLTWHRIQRAKDLLATGRMNVGQVAQAVGFSKSSYFSQAFQKEIGVAPRQYRRGERPPPGWAPKRRRPDPDPDPSQPDPPAGKESP